MSEKRPDIPDSERLEKLYRRAGDAEPDGRVDSAVLAKARRTTSRTRGHGLRHPGAWGVGIAAAASVILAVGIVFQRGWQPGMSDMPGASEPSESLMKDAEGAAAPPGAGADTGRRGAKETGPNGEMTDSDDAEVTGSRFRREDRGQAQAVPERKANQATMAAPATVNEEQPLNPEAWLGRIEKLVERGRLDSARRELRSFREAYPSVEIPPAILEGLDAE